VVLGCVVVAGKTTQPQGLIHTIPHGHSYENKKQRTALDAIFLSRRARNTGGKGNNSNRQRNEESNDKNPTDGFGSLRIPSSLPIYTYYTCIYRYIHESLHRHHHAVMRRQPPQKNQTNRRKQKRGDGRICRD